VRKHRLSAHGHRANQPSFAKRPFCSNPAGGASQACARAGPSGSRVCSRARVCVWSQASRPLRDPSTSRLQAGRRQRGAPSFARVGQTRPVENSRRQLRSQGGELREPAGGLETPGSRLGAEQAVALAAFPGGRTRAVFPGPWGGYRLGEGTDISWVLKRCFAACEGLDPSCLMYYSTCKRLCPCPFPNASLSQGVPPQYSSAHPPPPRPNVDQGAAAGRRCS
jgi:hypothetical protein